MSTSTKRTIVFAGGGTLGPVTPLLAVARRVREDAPEFPVLWIGTSFGPERRLVEGAGFGFHVISSGKLRRYFSFKNFTDIFRIVAGFFQALIVLRRVRACRVVSAGGFVAVPVVWAAAILRIPVHVHQQDWRPGLANRLSMPYASSITVALEKSLKDFDGRAVWTGNPVRPSVLQGDPERARARFGIQEGGRVLLVLGGGTGAASLNDMVRAAKDDLSSLCTTLHVTGAGKAVPAAEGDARYRQVEFIAEGMGDVYALADIVLTRAGMGTLSELSSLGKPTIVAPIPGSHQEDNARAFIAGADVGYFDGAHDGPERMVEIVRALFEDDNRRSRMADAMRNMNKVGADGAIAAIVMSGCAKG